MQRVVGVELAGTQILMIGDQFPIGVINLAILRLIDRHRERRRAVVAHGVQDKLEAVRLS